MIRRLIGLLVETSELAEEIFGRHPDPGPAGAWRHYGRMGHLWLSGAFMVLVLTVFAFPAELRGTTVQGFVITLCLLVIVTEPWARISYLKHIRSGEKKEIES